MTFESALRGIQECPGVLATVIADFAGIPVTSVTDGYSEIDEILAEYSTFIRDVASANRELHLGELEQLVVSGADRVVAITLITELYFLLTVVARDGNPGKARFASRIAAHKLRHEFV